MEGIAVGESFGSWLMRERAARDLTRADLAERVGCSLELIRKIERGQRRPSKQVAQRLAEQLGLPPNQHAAFVRAARGDEAPPAQPAHEFGDRFDQLPVPPTPLLGRADTVLALSALLTTPQVRLLTLTGEPGVGKTRLALELAGAVRAQFAHGVCFVSLAALNDPTRLLHAVLHALGLQETSAPAEEIVASFLRTRHLLLVLDNFEHLLSAAPQIGVLLAVCPKLVVLATSRAALRLRGERRVRVAPLPLPDLSRLPPAEALAANPAVELFVECAGGVVADFALHADNVAAVATLCARCDGLPLAIELLAARVAVLPPSALLAEHDGLRLLANGASDLPPRQQSLHASITWSYQLLDPAAQQLFARLGVFAGGWMLEAAEAIGDVQQGVPVLKLLTSLLENSLVRREEAGEEARFVMLETLRCYALEQLERRGETQLARRRHAVYFTALVERAEPEFYGRQQQRWLDRLRRERDNLYAALEWAESVGEIEMGLRLAASAMLYWIDCGQLHTGRKWLERLLYQLNDARGVVNVCAELGILALRQQRTERAVHLLAFSYALCEREGLAIARTLHSEVQRAVAAARLQLGPEQFDTLWATGAGMDLSHAIVLASDTE